MPISAVSMEEMRKKRAPFPRKSRQNLDFLWKTHIIFLKTCSGLLDNFLSWQERGWWTGHTPFRKDAETRKRGIP